MSDSFNADLLKDDADDDELEMEGGYKEYTVIMIDAQPNMLEPCNLEDKIFHGMSWLEASVNVAAAILRTKVIQGAVDEVAVLFYNTRAKKNDKNLDAVYVKHTMASPDARRVLQLKDFNLAKDFNSKIGAGSSEISDRSESLENALWVANGLLPGRPKTAGAYIDQRVVVFTLDSSPGALKTSIESNVENIARKGGVLQLAPLFRPGDGFDLKPFWGRLLSHAATNLPDASTSLTQTAGGSDEKYGGYEENEETVLSLESLSSVVRMRAYRKRAITRITWTLGPGGAELGVKLYQTIKQAWPAAKGAAVILDAVDNQPLVRTMPTLLDAQTGSILEKGQEPRFFYPSKPDGSFPIQRVESRDEIRQLKFPAPKGLSLLGFKPVEDLKPWHQLREATFIFPDEISMPGSLVAFVALHEAMLEREVMAVCVLVRGPSAEPRLVALVPQEEVASEDTGAMITPAGMYMFYLPYSDDLRYPELDLAFTGTERPQPSQAAVDAAAELVAALDLGDDFDPANIPNPHMQHWLKTIEEKAITLEAENEDDGDDGKDDEDDDDGDLVLMGTKKGKSGAAGVEDLAVPDAESFEAVGDLVDRFIAAICVPGAEGNLMGTPVSKRGTKRSAAASAVAADDLQELSDEVIAAKYAQGTLGKLTIKDLKPYLKRHNLAVSGKKEELVERITKHLEQQ